MKRWAFLAGFLLFIALCGSIAYWGMQLFKPPLRPVAAPPQSTNVVVNLPAATNLFGGRAAPLAVASNYQLTGVVVSKDERDSVAILVADGKPPKAVRMNSEVMPGVTVQEVRAQYVLLSEGGVPKRVELPVTAAPQAAFTPTNLLPGQGIQPAYPNTQPSALPPIYAPTPSYAPTVTAPAAAPLSQTAPANAGQTSGLPLGAPPNAPVSNNPGASSSSAIQPTANPSSTSPGYRNGGSPYGAGRAGAYRRGSPSSYGPPGAPSGASSGSTGLPASSSSSSTKP